MSKKMKAVFDAAKDVKRSYDNDGISDYMAQYDYGLLESVQNLVEAVGIYESWINEDSVYTDDTFNNDAVLQTFGDIDNEVNK